MTRLLFLATLGTLFAALNAAAGELPVETVKIEKSAERLEIEVAYPKTGVAAIDADIAAWARGEASAFEKLAASEPLPEPFNYGLYIDFSVERNDDAMFAISVSEEEDTGGAHPNHDALSFSYLRPDGWRVYLPEIFERQALARISALAIADLTGQLAGPDGGGDVDTIKGGAGPSWDNFSVFILGPDTLHLDFPPYQVASYAAGGQSVDIPLAKLKGLMRKDWRAPAASFDCDRAGTATEKAICGSVELARLDRAVSEAYGRKLRYSYEDAEKDAAKAAQRAWLAARDAQCATAAAGCLAQVYRARLAELNQ